MFFKKSQDEAESKQTETAVHKNGAAGAVEISARDKTPDNEDLAAPVTLDADEAKKRAAASKRMAASFGEIVLLMSQSPAEQHYALRDLDWLVAPAVRLGQFALAEAQSKTNGQVLPVGAILWAVVSSEIDQRLSGQETGPIRLAPGEWRSGDIPWIIHTVGEPKILGGLMEQLTKTVFKERAPKMRVRGQDGKAKVGEIHVKEKAA
ncbi:toxin-activating lysine-acyltransferase [Hyphomicrobium sp. LHD-15]|uniref:toxin-activating lysine-acyltransferase n=1 Tax=Hyphomicrobium sp. LHD-15 TaxID=3072142 RepID=UPI00280FEEB9|nr:toxin-activating lysine-acyltransferase [Hyphomicrobium sp. LHD-15]MDQ8700272.1 toxin-activating lysine-acyltransferase [Hyphomicrobium sp. LHD-15]